MDRLGPTGFWSYTSQDDTSSRGRLSQLRRLLADEVQQMVGRTPPVHLFQDVAAIPPGAGWEQQILEAIAESSFMIPVITPGYLQSEWCCKEVSLFREREKRLGRDDLIFPIYYNDIEDFNTFRRGEIFDPDVLRLLRERQWVDFRDLRHRDPDSEEVARRLERLASGIRRVMFRTMGETEPRPDTPPIAEIGISAAPAGEAAAGDGARGTAAAIADPPAPPPTNQRPRNVPPVPRPQTPPEPETPDGRRAAPGASPRKWTFKWLGFGTLGIIAVSVLVALLPRQEPVSVPPAPAPPPIVATAPKTFLVFFDWNQTSLTARGEAIVADVASYCGQSSCTQLDVDGNTDTSEGAPFGGAQALSERRARVVAASLVRDGVPQDVIAMHAYGSTKLLVPTGPGVREPQNRRVEMIVR